MYKMMLRYIQREPRGDSYMDAKKWTSEAATSEVQGAQNMQLTHVIDTCNQHKNATNDCKNSLAYF